MRWRPGAGRDSETCVSGSISNLPLDLEMSLKWEGEDEAVQFGSTEVEKYLKWDSAETVPIGLVKS